MKKSYIYMIAQYNMTLYLCSAYGNIEFYDNLNVLREQKNKLFFYGKTVD